MPIYQPSDADTIHCAFENILHTLIHEWTRPLTSVEVETFFSGMTNCLDDLQDNIERAKRREEMIRAQIQAAPTTEATGTA